MSKLLLISCVVIIVTSHSVYADSEEQHRRWNADLITDFTTFLKTIKANASNSIDLECWNGLMGLSIGLQSNDLWALKGIKNYA